MTAHTTPNTFKPYQWACVVSAVVWAEYKLSGAGTLTAKTLRGPLIVWATDTGEGEDLPTVQPPTLSALEARAAKVNTRAAFERFCRAAGGKRRLKKAIKKTRHFLSAAQINTVFCDIRLASFFAWIKDRTKSVEEQGYELLFSRIDDFIKLGYIPDCFIQVFIEKLSETILFFRSGEVNKLLFHAVMSRRKGTFCLALKHLEAAAYRAHLARRVKPVQRRTRAPRPLYARPRPPTAPTAPPLLEA